MVPFAAPISSWPPKSDAIPSGVAALEASFGSTSSSGVRTNSVSVPRPWHAELTQTRANAKVLLWPFWIVRVPLPRYVTTSLASFPWISTAYVPAPIVAGPPVHWRLSVPGTGVRSTVTVGSPADVRVTAIDANARGVEAKVTAKRTLAGGGGSAGPVPPSFVQPSAAARPAIRTSPWRVKRFGNEGRMLPRRVGLGGMGKGVRRPVL